MECNVNFKDLRCCAKPAQLPLLKTRRGAARRSRYDQMVGAVHLVMWCFNHYTDIQLGQLKPFISPCSSFSPARVSRQSEWFSSKTRLSLSRFWVDISTKEVMCSKTNICALQYVFQMHQLISWGHYKPFENLQQPFKTYNHFFKKPVIYRESNPLAPGHENKKILLPGKRGKEKPS